MILIVGDGNFSFTLAILQIRKYDSQIISTSFDTEQQLVQKYDDFRLIQKKILKYDNVQLVHGVNCLELKTCFDCKFERIIWNHPHLGVENFKTHQFLFLHFFKSALQVLDTRGRIVLSVVQGQETRWQVVEAAEKFGLSLLSLELFDEGEYPGYVVKRNQHGASFKNSKTKRHVGTMMKSFVFEFGFGKGIEATEDILKELYEGRPFPSVQSVQAFPRKNRKTAKPVPPSDLRCIVCEKQLMSAWGYIQHFHMVHELEKYGKDWKPIRPPALECQSCGRKFVDQESLWQHETSKHIEIDLKPVNDLSCDFKDLELDDHYDFVACDVCGQSCIRNRIDLHLDSFKPLMGLDAKCTICQASFIEHRALLQHYKFCSLKLSNSRQLQVS
jgi:hypothetical protein